jgi:hypothetical protein
MFSKTVIFQNLRKRSSSNIETDGIANAPRQALSGLTLQIKLNAPACEPVSS